IFRWKVLRKPVRTEKKPLTARPAIPDSTPPRWTWERYCPRAFRANIQRSRWLLSGDRFRNDLIRISWYPFPTSRPCAHRILNDEGVFNFRVKFPASTGSFRAAAAARALVAWQCHGSRTACGWQNPSGLHHGDDDRGPSL